MSFWRKLSSSQWLSVASLKARSYPKHLKYDKLGMFINDENYFFLCSFYNMVTHQCIQ